MTRTATALIIGGGVAGPAAAMALQMVGIESAIYEARPGGAAHVGAFLTLAPNGIDALRVLGADVAVLDAGFPTPGITLRSSTGKRLGETSTGAPLPDGTVGHTLRRSDLYRILCETAAGRGIRVQDGKRLVTATQTGDQVRALFADGSEAVADILIGCDGVNSAVRNVIDPGAPAPAYAGLLTTGGYAPGLDIDSTSGTYEMIFGKQAFFGYVTSPGGEVWWFANVPTPAEPGRGDEPAVTGEAWRPKLLQSYAHDAGPAMALIRATKQIMPLWPVRTLAHLPVWHHGRLAVIGDAAHAPSPSSGQGASLAIEDAVVLAKCLRDLPSPQAAFAHYEAQRRRRVERIVRWAARVNSSKAAGPLASRFRDALLPTILKMTANSKANTEIGSYHVDWEKRTTL